MSFAVASWVFTMPFGLWPTPKPLAPMGESIAIGVEDMVTDSRVAFTICTVEKRAFSYGLVNCEGDINGLPWIGGEAGACFYLSAIRAAAAISLSCLYLYSGAVRLPRKNLP